MIAKDGKVPQKVIPDPCPPIIRAANQSGIIVVALQSRCVML
jgi:hypothetical protein